MSRPRRGIPGRRIALVLVLLLAATGLLFKMLRPFFESQTAKPVPGQIEVKSEQVTLKRVIDGDTIEVRWRGHAERVRLLRINTPERGRRGYFEATHALEQLLGGTAIGLEFEEPGLPARDKYERLLAYVLADGTNANVEQVRLGWTRFWTKYGQGRLASDFATAEAQARAARIGLWTAEGWNAQPPP